MCPPFEITGLVLAAGAGTRYGRPKALVTDATGIPWVQRAVTVLRDGGCVSVAVALGAEADAAAQLVPPGAQTIRVARWHDGLSATLKESLRHAVASGSVALVIVTVDTPQLPASAVRRVIDAAGVDPGGALIQAMYDGMPGHPVLIGSSHFEGIADELSGDRGARRVLVARGVHDIECIDLWTGADVDSPV